MRVLRVLNELRPSGVEAGLVASADLWADRGMEVEILTLGTRPGPYAGALKSAGFRLHHIPRRPFPAFCAAYLRLLRSKRYDVVHVHPEGANFWTAALARAAGCPTVVRSVHNVFEFRGALRLRRRAQRRILRLLGVKHVSVSASVQAAELRNFSNPSQLIYNAYDERRFAPASPAERAAARHRYGVGEHDFVVVSIGNCSPVKNHHELIGAIAAVLPELPVRYLHVGLERGDGAERQLADRLGLGDRVAFLGYTDPVSALHAADCFVMPSLWEGLGNAALEALACGVPCILADVAGLRDLRAHVSGILWVRPVPSDIEVALRHVHGLDGPASSSLRGELAAAVRIHFRTERAVEEYADLYAGRRAGSPPR